MDAAEAETPTDASAADPAVAGWWQRFELSAFADAYYAINWSFPKPQTGRNRFRGFDPTNGFAISWAGFDVVYPTKFVDGTINLRFGPTAEAFAGERETENGLHILKQAYATWRPTGESDLYFDLGKFDTIYGVEVAESQRNTNYTRGLVHQLAQPWYHTGLRAGIQPTEMFGITALLVNGWNTSIDSNAGITGGVQLALGVPATEFDGDVFGAALGYMIGPEQTDVHYPPCDVNGNGVQTMYDVEARPGGAARGDCVVGGPDGIRIPADGGGANTEGLRHFLDLVVTANPVTSFSLWLNADLGIENVQTLDPNAADNTSYPTQVWFGIALAGQLQFTDVWGASLRGEYLKDPDGRFTSSGGQFVTPGDASEPLFGYVLNPALLDPVPNDVQDLDLGSVTLTVDALVTSNLLLRLENRLDVAGTEVFGSGLRSYGNTQFTTTLGAVVMAQ